MSERDLPTAEEVIANEAAEKERRDRAIDHTAEIWLEMEKTPAFQQLMDTMAAQLAESRGYVLDMVERDVPVDQRAFDYYRGLRDGINRPARIMDTARGRLAKKDSSKPETNEKEVKYW